MVQAVEDAGLVSRHPDQHDARATQVRLTARGRRTTTRAVAAVEDADDIFFAGLERRRLTIYLDLTREVIHHNTEAASSAAPGG